MKVASCELRVSCVGDVGGIFEAASGTKKCRIVVGATHTHTRTCPETEHHISVCRPVSIVPRRSSFVPLVSLVSLFLWLGLGLGLCFSCCAHPFQSFVVRSLNYVVVSCTEEEGMCGSVCVWGGGAVAGATSFLLGIWECAAVV